jgi:hypothetical protein
MGKQNRTRVQRRGHTTLTKLYGGTSTAATRCGAVRLLSEGGSEMEVK